MRFLVLILALVFATQAAQLSQLRGTIEQFVASRQAAIYRELAELLSIPNVAADRSNIRRNAEYLNRLLLRRGVSAEVLETNGNPLVYGETRVPGATRTILFYIHYDGQPVDPSGWKQPSPFQPVLRDGRLEDGAIEIRDLANVKKFEDSWRVYARSASDDKSPVIALCAALDALRASGRAPTSHLKIILDGEEEAGSPSLTAAIDRYREKLRADVMLILDGPVHPSGRPTLNFGARGNVTVELTVYGPKFALHSGHFGNWVPNPAMRLSQLLASMKDDRGRVVIEGFYDGLRELTEEERRILSRVPDDPAQLKNLFGFSEPDGVASSLQEALQFPSLNVRGLRSAYVGGEARTIIPSEATAAIDIRLVKETPGAAMLGKIRAHIQKQGYHIVENPPDDATRLRHPKIVRMQTRGPTEAYRTEIDLPISKLVSDSLERMWGQEPVRVRTSGGTVPISQFIRTLGFPAISVPTVNFDNNQHSENENLKLGHFWKGIVTIAAVLTM